MARRRISNRVSELISARREAEVEERRGRAQLEQRRALSEAESARRDLEEVFRHLPVGVIIADARTGRLVSANAEVDRIWRQPFVDEGATAGYASYRGFHPEDRRPYAPEEWPLARSVATGEIVDREVIDVVRGDGTHGTIEASSCPIHDDDGEIVAAVVAFADVTERTRAERALRLLAETGELLDSSLDVEQTIERITQLVVPPLADVCSVYIVEDERTARRIAVSGADESFDELVADMLRRGPIDVTDERNPIAEVIRTGRSAAIGDMGGQIVEDIAEDPEQAALLARLGVNSTAIAPLVARGTTLGALLLGAFGERRALEERDLPLVEEIARRAALALDNARLYNQEHRNAELLQRSLLPERLPPLDAAEATARYVASGAGEQVGGDWYDVIRLPDGRTGLVIGDVAGHGLRASAAMGRLRSALRAFALESESPAIVLERLNAFERRLGDRDMATVLYAVHDAADGTLRLASAGHPAPLAVVPGEGARQLGAARGLPIGVRGRARFEEAVEPVAPGTTIVLFTDGLVERRDEPLDVGIERVAAAAAEAGGGDLERLCETLLHAALGGARPADDVALLVFRPLEIDAARFDAAVAADPEALSSLRQRLRLWLRAGGAPADAVEEIVTACGEACANAIEHAYGPADAALAVHGEIESGSLELVVADRGAWRATRSEDRGLGLTIMRALMDDVSIDVDDDGTRVRMQRRIVREPAA
jgi:serine phosphatase RsbU (regulator of sigma subunit)/anti-sigma regulatory factor (Ser/Thr protein kinase)/PAS domain-containing protein